MNWKQKAAVQRMLARLPQRASHSVYYFVQRCFGRLRRTNPWKRLAAGVGILDRIAERDADARGARFLEVGTGRRLNVPIALYLGGAGAITTVDVNPYLRADLIRRDVEWIGRRRHEIKALFGAHALLPGFNERLQQLVEADVEIDLPSLLTMMNVRYLSPADAACLDLPDGSIDYHVSYTVLEHVPPDVLCGIFREGARVLRPGGRFVHFVDFGDHFAQADPAISSINFLQFSDAQWQARAGNRYAYHNRLRVDDLAALMREAGLNVEDVEAEIDQRALDDLHDGFPLHRRFAGKSAQTNASLNAWVVASPVPSKSRGGWGKAQGGCHRVQGGWGRAQRCPRDATLDSTLGHRCALPQPPVTDQSNSRETSP